MVDNTNTQPAPWLQHHLQPSYITSIPAQPTQWVLIHHNLRNDCSFSNQMEGVNSQRFQADPDTTPSKDQWSPSEELELYSLHDQLGNRWAIISQKLGSGRTDNDVKNHFYSRLRRSLRRLNKYIWEKDKRSSKEVKSQTLYKIIEAADEHFKSEPICSSQLSSLAIKLKNAMLTLSDSPVKDGGQAQLQTLIAGIQRFNQQYKRKPKKMRRSACGLAGMHNSPLQELTQNGLPSSAIPQLPSSHSIFNPADAKLSMKGEINWQSHTKSHTQKMISPIILTSSHHQDALVPPLEALNGSSSLKMAKFELYSQAEFKLLEESEAQVKVQSTAHHYQQTQ